MEWTATEIIWKVCNESNIHSLSSSNIINENIAFIAERALVCKQSFMASLQRVRQHFESANNVYHIRLQSYETVCREFDNSMRQLSNAIA